jgi:hypothetical protein
MDSVSALQSKKELVDVRGFEPPDPLLAKCKLGALAGFATLAQSR